MGSSLFPSCPAHFLLFSPQPHYDNERVVSDGNIYIHPDEKTAPNKQANNNSNKQNNNKLEILKIKKNF